MSSQPRLCWVIFAIRYAWTLLLWTEVNKRGCRTKNNDKSNPTVGCARQICREHPLSAHLKKMHNKKIENIKDKVTGYNICNGSFRWQILPSINVILHQYTLAFNVFEIITFKNAWRRKVYEGHKLQHSQWHHWWQISDFLSDGNINVCSISHHLWDIRNSRKSENSWPWK